MADVVNLPNGDSFQLAVPYTAREASGVTALVVISCLSLTAVVGLLGAISLSAFNTRSWKDQGLFVRTHVAAYFISLLLCDFFQAIGSILNATWIRQMGVNYGSTCIAQGVLKQLSDVGSAVWTLVIAINTFCLLFLEIKLRQFVLWSTLIAGWFGIGAIVIAGPASLDTVERGPFHAISGYWCWISPEYPTERITLGYMFMFISAILCFLIYTLIYLRLRGNVVVTGWRLRFRRIGRDSSGSDWRGRVANDQAMRISRQMLLVWAGADVPFSATIFSGSVFLLSGVVNVVLFSTTRRILPTKSLAVGKWRISEPRPVTPPPVEDGIDPYYKQEYDSDLRSEATKVASDKELLQTPPSLPRRANSTDSERSVYSIPADPPTLPLKVKSKDPTSTRETTPPELQLGTNRESIGFESMYNMYVSPQGSAGPGSASPYRSPQWTGGSSEGYPSQRGLVRPVSQVSQWSDIGDAYGGIVPDENLR